MRILIVEDEKKVASFIKQGFEEEGYAVDWAADGREGMLLALDGVHDLIILDLNLPKMDGLQVLQELRQSQGESSRPAPHRQGHDRRQSFGSGYRGR